MKTSRAWWRMGAWLVALCAAIPCWTWAEAVDDETSPQPDRVSSQGVSPEWAAPAGNASGEVDYASFRLIVERNIFNGNRSGQRITSTRNSSRLRSVQVDSFALVGTLVSSEGPLAFFDGSQSDFCQVLKRGDTIAGYRINEILPAGVRLAEGTNVTDLCVGNGMRREEGGGWRVALEASRYSSGSSRASSGGDPERDRGSDRSDRSWGRGNSPGERAELSGPNDTGSDDSSNADVNDVLKRLMEQREKEMQ